MTTKTHDTVTLVKTLFDLTNSHSRMGMPRKVKEGD